MLVLHNLIILSAGFANISIIYVAIGITDVNPDHCPILFKSYSKYPACHKDISFWIKKGNRICILFSTDDYH